MKSRYSFLLLIMLSVAGLISCTKETSKETDGKPVSAGDFYATINGSLWNADSLQVVLVDPNAVSINGLSKTGEQISMILPNFKVGTYPISSTSIPYALYANLLNGVSDVYYSNAPNAGGVVIITAIDTIGHLISGTFQFNLVNPSDNSVKTITEGVFDYVPYTINGVVPPPPGAAADTLKAKIDGVQFEAVTIQNSILPSPTGGADQLVISGLSGSATQAVSLLMPSTVGPGTYSLDFAKGEYVGIYYPDIQASQTMVLVSDDNGSLTIISNNNSTRQIKGTFNFVASPFTSGTPATFTEGYFSINY